MIFKQCFRESSRNVHQDKSQKIVTDFGTVTVDMFFNIRTRHLFDLFEVLAAVNVNVQLCIFSTRVFQV